MWGVEVRMDRVRRPLGSWGGWWDVEVMMTRAVTGRYHASLRSSEHDQSTIGESITDEV